MSLQNIEFIIGAVSLLFAYVFSVILVGRAEAEVAVRAGDDNPKEAGFLSWDPFVFVDIPGFICTMILGLGWGRQLPFNPHHVTGHHKLRSIFFVYMAQPFFALLLALCALIVNVFLVGPQSLNLAFWGLVQTVHGIPFQQLARQSPGASPLIIVFATILLAIISFNTFTAVWSLINNGFHYILFVGAEREHDYMQHAEALAFFGPLIVLILFTGPLRYILLKILVAIADSVATLACSIASFCGALV